MKKNKFIIIAICLYWSFGVAYSYAQKNIKNQDFIKKAIKYSEYYDFIEYDKNMLEWYQADAISPFFEKLKRAGEEKVVILHIGDSHIQSDIGAGTTRAMLQQVFGFGGRGIVFPYQAAKTHSAFDYFAQPIGTWTSSKNVELKPKLNIGISGITVFTTDSNAEFKLVFRKQYYSIQPDFRKIRIYCHKGPESFDTKIRNANSNKWFDLECNAKDSLPYVELTLPNASDTIVLSVNKTNEIQKYFECYGIEIQSTKNSGIQYISVGINGAGYHSFFNQNLTSKQLKGIKPDLIIFDIGINDFYRGAFNYQYVMSSINKAIALFKQTVPDIVFLLPNAQDIYYRGRNITNCADYSALTRLIAKEQNVALYDYFQIAGGERSMLQWSKNGLCQRDKIHLSFKGYRTKGELLCNAILNSYALYLSGKQDSLLVLNDRIDTANFGKWIINKSTYYNRQIVDNSDKINSYKDKPISQNITPKDGQYYIVRSGDNLGSIALKYNVSVSDLQKWNNLKSSKIYAGQKLLVSQTGGKIVLPTYTTPNKTQQAIGKKVIYEIKQGDNLYSIASKHKVSVDDLKQWNGLSSNSITAGKSLVIYTDSSIPITPKTQTTTQNKTNRNISYKVKSGDSLWSIANKHNTTVDRIKQDNKLTSDKLNLGQKLIIN